MADVQATYTGKGNLRARNLSGSYVDHTPAMAGALVQVPADMVEQLRRSGVISVDADAAAPTDDAGELRQLREARAELQESNDRLVALNEELEARCAALEASNAALVERVEAGEKERAAIAAGATPPPASKSETDTGPDFASMSKAQLLEALKVATHPDGSKAYPAFTKAHGPARQAKVEVLREFLEGLSGDA